MNEITVNPELIESPHVPACNIWVLVWYMPDTSPPHWNSCNHIKRERLVDAEQHERIRNGRHTRMFHCTDQPSPAIEEAAMLILSFKRRAEELVETMTEAVQYGAAETLWTEIGNAERWLAKYGKEKPCSITW